MHHWFVENTFVLKSSEDASECRQGSVPPGQSNIIHRAFLIIILQRIPYKRFSFFCVCPNNEESRDHQLSSPHIPFLEHAGGLRTALSFSFDLCLAM